MQLLCRTAFPGRRKQRRCSRRPGKAVLPVCLTANLFNQQSRKRGTMLAGPSLTYWVMIGSFQSAKSPKHRFSPAAAGARRLSGLKTYDTSIFGLSTTEPSCGIQVLLGRTTKCAFFWVASFDRSSYQSPNRVEQIQCKGSGTCTHIALPPKLQVEWPSGRIRLVRLCPRRSSDLTIRRTREHP